MEKIKSNVNTLCGLAIIFLSIINILIKHIGYVFRPRSYIIFFICYLALVFGVTFLSVKYNKNASKTSKVFAFVMPVIVLVYLITLIFGFDFSKADNSYNLLYYEALFFISIMASAVLFFVYCPVKWLKILACSGSIAFSVAFAYIVMITLFASMMGVNTIVQSVNSPDDTYVAYLVSSDQGALGGSTQVFARNIKKDIPLLSGRLMKEKVSLWWGDWGYNPYLEWENDSVVLIGGEKCDVKNLLE